MSVVIHIPGDPIAKGRPRFVRATGRTYTPAKTMQAERNISQYAVLAMRGRTLFDCPLAVTIDCAFLWPQSVTKRRRSDPNGQWKETRPDADNLAKIVDALNGVVWTDDARIVWKLVRKFYSDRPGTTITVRPVEQEAFLPPDEWVPLGDAVSGVVERLAANLKGKAA